MWLGRIVWNLVKGAAMLLAVLILMVRCSERHPTPQEPSENPVDNMRWAPG